MGAPTLLVEFGFTKSGLDYVWNNISSYVRTVDIGRGVNREIDNYSAGQCSVVLSNANRYFDPTNTSSPYNGLIQPSGAIRIKSNGYIIYYGFIDSWDFDFPEYGFDATATINAYDALGILAKASLDTVVNLSDYTGYRINNILNRTEVGWNSALTNIDVGNNTVQGDTISQGTNVLSYIQQVAKSEPGDVFASRDGLVTFRDRGWLDNSYSASSRRYNYCKNPSFQTNNTFWSNGTVSSTVAKVGTKSLFVTFNGVSLQYDTVYDETNAVNYVAGTTYTASAYVYFPTVVSANVQIALDLYNGATLLLSTFQTIAVTGGGWTRIDTGPAIAPAGTDRVYFSIIKGTTGGQLYVDGMMIEPSATLGIYFDGTNVLDGVAGNRYTPKWTGTANASSSYLDTAVLNPNPTPVTPIEVGDYSAPTKIPYTNITTSYNSENLFNRISIQRVLGSIQLIEDTAKQAIYGIRTYSASDYLNDTDAQVANIASELLSTYVSPEFRAEQVSFALHGLSGINQNILLQLDLRSLLKVYFTPARTGSQMVKTYVVIGISHSLSDSTHTMSFNLASIENQPFRLNSTILGVLDSNKIGY